MTSKTIYYCVYRITNLVEKKHYYGYKSSKIHPTKVIGISYFSSSSDKNFIIDQKQNPKNYKYKVVQIFDSKEKALGREIKLHSKFNVGINPNFYHRAKQTSIGFDRSGLTTMKNKYNEIVTVDKNIIDDNLIGVNTGFVVVRNGSDYIRISSDDPRYLLKELLHCSSGLTVVKNNNVNLSISTDDPRYLSGELKHIYSGSLIVKDKNNNLFRVSLNDPRYLSGELVSAHKNLINVKDKNGNFFKVNKDDPRYLSGELVGFTSGRAVVKDINNNISMVSITDPRYLSGELIHVNSGCRFVDSNGNKFKINKNDPRYLSGEFKKCKNNVKAGMCNIRNLKTQIVCYMNKKEILTNLNLVAATRRYTLAKTKSGELIKILCKSERWITEDLEHYIQEDKSGGL